MAAQRVITKVVKGESVSADKKETERRMGICHQCEFYRSSDATCSQCGCFILLKARLTTEKCPVDKWAESASEEPQVDESEEVILSVEAIMQAELEVRDVLPPDSRLVQLLNQFHRDEMKGGGCKSCRRKRYNRNLQVALIDFLNQSTKEQKQALRDVFPNTTAIRAGKKTIDWSAFGVSS
jgi:hypothetical protein